MENSQVSEDTLKEWINQSPDLQKVINLENVFWVNKDKANFEAASKRSKYTNEDVIDAADRLDRFSAFIRTQFPVTEKFGGIIESPLTSIPSMKKHLNSYYDTEITGNLFLKRDDLLPIAGTIKARGAIYEVLKHAEDLAIEAGILSGYHDDYAKFATPVFKGFFKKYKIVVGTTGNLGISVGVMGATLGFEVTVHMSVEAKQWKKDYLRNHGVTVVEHNTNFTKAVELGRAESASDPHSYFVDDEHSVDLFLGYTVAGQRLQKQLQQKNVIVDEKHPLFVYLPCGIGGSPGGITFGLKQIFGDNVHCFFAEPAHMPSMLLGLLTKHYDGVSIYDFGIDGITGMDGLAVPRTSGFVSKLMHDFFDGGYTVQEKETYDHLTALADLEGIYVEPAAVAGVPGACHLLTSESGQNYIKDKKFDDCMDNATHIAWATGGSMVPITEMRQFYNMSLNYEEDSK